MEFLSDEWVRALEQAARETEVPEELELSIAYRVVTDGDELGYALVFSGGRVRVTKDHQDADVRITADRSVAEAVQRGERSALDGFMRGDIRVGGDLQKLTASQDALELTGDLFASVRATTT